MTSPPGAPFAPFMQASQALVQQFFNALATGADPQTAAVLRGAATPGADTLAKFTELQSRLMQQHAQLWTSMLARQQGGQDGQAVEPVAKPAPGDRRFSAAQWSAEPYYDYLRQSYLINSRFAEEAVEALDVDERTREKLRFSVRQMIEATSPSNFIATNPEVLRLAQETQGGSISQGLKNLLDDVQKGHLTITDESAFEVGRNIAVTEGAVVLENEVMQLIQYSPLTGEVFERPLLVVPPCINKFYILDLQPENSFVRHAVEQGHTVFMVSWRNVKAEQGRLTWDDYLTQGVLDPIDAVRAITKQDQINTLGFCVGGTLLSSALGVLAARGEDKVASLTLLASMLDFSDTGELGLFVDEASVAGREATLGAGGIMPGKELAFVFSALRANDLVWSYVVNNYLKGQQPAAFDILFWNADSTNLPGPMYCSYLRNMYLTNSLREPGRLTMLGEKIDLSAVKVPAYVLATREDHIVPWKTAYLSTAILGGDKRFVLGASGHVAGIVNPASKNRRSFWVGEGLPGDPQAWFGQATEVPGSWWRDWASWLGTFSGARRKAKKALGNARYKPIDPAPGRYVKEKAG